jgi:uncharacterized protein (DUF2147 family)
MSSIKFDASLDTSKLDSSIKESKRTVADYAKDVEKAGDQMDKSFDLTTKSIKEAIANQKALVKELEADLKKLEKAYKDLTPGKESQVAAKQLRDTKAYLAQEQQELIRLQEQQIDMNKREEASADSLTGKITKWALSLGGAAAALGVLKKAFGETTQGMNLFNTVGAVTKQILNDIVSGAGLSMNRIASAIAIQREFNALRMKQYKDAFESAKLENEYQQLYSASLDQTLTRAERLKVIDAALEAHNKSIGIQVQATQEQLALTERSLQDKPTNEKLIKEYADLHIRLENLDAQRVSSTKRLTRQRSALIKEEIDEEKKWREDLHSGLMEMVEEYEQTNQKNASQLRQLNNEIEAAKLDGKDKELLILEQKYKEDLETYRENEEIKTALGERYAQDRYLIEMKYLDQIKAENKRIADAIQKLDPGRGYSILNRALGNSGTTPITGAGMLRGTNQKQTEIEKQVNENLEKQLALRLEILNVASGLVYSIGETLGLQDKELNQLNGYLNAFSQFASGNIAGAVGSLVSTVIESFPSAAEKYNNEIERLNKLLEQQTRLIDESQRKGGQQTALQGQVDILKETEEKTAAALAEAQKKLDNSIGGIFFNSRYERVQDLKEELINVQNELADANQALTDLLGGGVTENTIAETIAEGFREGKTSVDDFAEYTNRILIDAVMSAFQAEILGPEITALQEYISQALADKALTTDEKAKIDERIKLIADANKQLWEDLTGSLDLEEAGTSGLAGGIQRQLTEETAGELAGIIRNQRDDIKQAKDYTKIGVNHLAGIEANTAETVTQLQLAVVELKNIVNNTKPVYSGEL